MKTQSRTLSSDWPLDITAHARQRMAQRNISMSEVGFVIGYGTQSNDKGAVLFHLRKKDIPQELRPDPDISRLEGISVVASKDTGSIITVYRGSKVSQPRQMK